MSRLSLPDLHSTRVYASEAGVLPVTLWFPGSELRVRARSGEAWLDVQVSDTTWLVRGSETGEQPSPQRFYRCRIARLEPRDFVPNLPGQDRVPPLPKPPSKTSSTLMSVGVASTA